MSAGQDLAGIGYRYHVAGVRAGHDYRSVMRSPTYLAYPEDIRWLPGQDAEVRSLFESAEVVHLNGSFQPYQLLGGPAVNKPAIIEQHGTQFRGYPQADINEARRRRITQAVSTIDLRRPAPELLHWLPAPYDLPSLAELAAAHRREPDGLVRIATAPTARGIKSTDALIAAVRQLRTEGLPVELDVIEQQPWSTCLERKAAADVFFDQVILGYGCNAIEAWAMGLPVIAGADPWTLEQMRLEFGKPGIPFYQATEATMKDAVREMVLSADLRTEWAGRGLRHAKRYHAEKPALARALELYETAIETAAAFSRRARIQLEGAPETREGPGVFRSDIYR